MSSTASPAGRGARLTTLYVVTWGFLAAAAIAYLCVLAFRPEMGAGLVNRVLPAQSEPTQVQRTISKALAELQSVRQSIAEVWTQIAALKDAASKQEDHNRRVTELDQDVAELRSALAGQDERGRTLAARLAAVEARGDETASPHMRAAPQSASARRQHHDMAGVTVTGSIDDRAVRAPGAEARAAKGQQAREQPKEMVAAATPMFGTPKVVAAAPKAPVVAGPVGLQLATAPSTDALRLAWLRISSTNKDALQDLEPRYVEVKIASGVTYRLVAGPVASNDEGARMCADLKAKKVSCAVASYKGDPL